MDNCIYCKKVIAKRDFLFTNNDGLFVWITNGGFLRVGLELDEFTKWEEFIKINFCPNCGNKLDI